MTESEREQMLSAVKLILGIEDNKKDKLLAFIAEDTVNLVLAYCRIEILPIQLHGAVAQMCAGAYKRISKENIDITAIAQGDRKLEFFVPAEDMLSDFRERLKPFVNRRGRLPSEVKLI